MKRLSCIVLLLLFVSVLRAQTLTTYSCDFEDPQEVSKWQMNVGDRGPSCANHWYCGAAGSFGMNSTAGLYVSGGKDADTLSNNYVNALGNRITGEFVTSYRYVDLADGQYTLVFDWMGNGTTDDALYVVWINQSEITNGAIRAIISNNTAAAAPAYCTETYKHRGASSWRSVSTSINVSGGEGGNIVVVWFTKAGTTPMNPSGAVDNISIFQGTCAAPTSVAYNGNTSSLTWQGNANSYDVIMYNVNTEALSSFTGVTTTSAALGTLTEEGMYNFYVRSVRDENAHSEWVFTSKFVWIKGARCIDIFDLTPDNSGAAKCYSGSTESLKLSSGQVDYGYADERSLHTIHYVQGETDPRTGNRLRTIPEGEIASIRLGGYWDAKGNMSSTIEYQYNVQAGVSDILELKYASVLEYADYHGESEEARFKLEVLRNGQVIDACAQGDFKAGFGETSSWHVYNYKPDEVMYWNDWQTIAVSLRNYVGQTLTIRLTSYSCTATIHSGYAYFTLSCRGGDLQGIACGDFSTDHFEAPEGFNYRWYREDDPYMNVLSTDRVFNIDADDPNIYLVDLVSLTRSQCYYTLEANPNPRFPQARGSLLRTTTGNCQQTAYFSQDSRVVRINRQTRDSSFVDEPVESVIWNFGDGSDPVESMDATVSHVFPAEGGEYDVTVTATMSNGICEDTHLIHISLPDLTSPDTRDTTHICGEGTDRIDTIVRTNLHGCEYLELHHYYYHPTFDTLYEERMCEGGRYFFPGNRRYYTHSVDTALNLKTIYGCDSIIRLKLIVDPKLIVEYPSEARVCLEDSYFEIPYQVVSGAMDSIHVYFSERDCERGFQPVYAFANGEDIRIDIPDNLYPDNYQIRLEFGGERCFMEPQSATLMMLYKTNILYWNDGFISIQNADYNGGNFEFVAYEWYRNGVRLETNQSYVPTTVDDIDAVFELRLMRRNENYYIESCPLVYNPYTAVEEVYAGGLPLYPTYVERGGSITVAAGDGFSVYSVLGARVARYEASDTERTITAPAHNGVYIVVFDSKQSTQIIVH